MPHLVKIAAQYESLGLQVLVITEAPTAQVLLFVDEHSLPFHVYADAETVRVAYGIDMIWGSPAFLLDREGRVVAEELDAKRAIRQGTEVAAKL